MNVPYDWQEAEYRYFDFYTFAASTTSGASGLNNEDSASTTGPDITAVLDQKNYVEELNRHLK